MGQDFKEFCSRIKLTLEWRMAMFDEHVNVGVNIEGFLFWNCFPLRMTNDVWFSRQINDCFKPKREVDGGRSLSCETTISRVAISIQPCLGCQQLQVQFIIAEASQKLKSQNFYLASMEANNIKIISCMSSGKSPDEKKLKQACELLPCKKQQAQLIRDRRSDLKLQK